MTNTTVLINVDVIPELEALSKASAALVRKLKAGSRAGMKPKDILPADQAWFWTKEWQAKEQAADEAEARGEYDDFDSMEALITDLHKHV